MPPNEDDVRRQLDRLLASATFANAGRMSRFLRFVVERTLAGEGDRLKEYVIGVEVFDRDATYDPRVDSIVRVEAARLRSKLAEYYAGEGSSDTIVLTLPKGGYAAAITRAPQHAPRTHHAVPPPAPHAPHIPSRRTALLTAAGALLAAVGAVTVVAWAPGESSPEPRVAVLPFESDDANGAALGRIIAEGVAAELVRADRFAVVSSSAARAEQQAGRRPREIAAALGADVVIEARLTAQGERVRVEARAASGHTEEKLWVHDFVGDSAGLDALEREIAAVIGAWLGATSIVHAK